MSDAAALLAAARCGATLAPTLERAPRDAREAVRRWLAAECVLPGGHRSPPAGWLAELVADWCAARGWDCEVLGLHVSRELLAAAYEPVFSHNRRGYRMHRDSAARLWALVREKHPSAPSRPPGRKATHLPPRRCEAPARERPLLSERQHNARPLLDSLGRVWPSAAEAARLLRAHPEHIQTAALRRAQALGVRWRQLSPAEVALLPPETRAGDVVPLCWHECCLAGRRRRGGAVP